MKESMTAHTFGISERLDSFNVSFTIASFVTIVIGSAFQIALVPVYIETKVKYSKDEANSLAAAILKLCLYSLLTVCFIVLVSFPYLLPLLFPKFDASKLQTTLFLCYLFIPVIVLGGCALTVTGILNAEESFSATAIIPGITTVLTVVALYCLVDQLGIYSLIIGLITGAILELIVLLKVLRLLNIKLSFKSSIRESQVMPVIRNALPIAGASMLSGVMPLVDQGFAAQLRSGDISALAFGSRVISLVIGLFAASVAATVLPYFSNLAVERKWQVLKNMFTSSLLKFILPGTLVALLAILFFSFPLVKLLFQSGAFTTNSTVLVSRIQSIYALQIPAYIIHLIGIRLLSAMQENTKAVLIALVSLIVNILADYLLSRWLGVEGIAWATSLVYLTAMFITLISVYQSLNRKINVV
jgi:putative peptidoglycan lipid II flippase